MISVGIVGASGYTGEELTKILLKHPEVKIESLTSRSHEGKNIKDVFKIDMPGVFKTPTLENLSTCDVVFFATPNGVAMNMANDLIKNNIRIIDISADFRLSDVNVWEHWYGKSHACPSLLADSVYGLPEISNQKNKIKNAMIIANPGCYPTSSLLALLPIYESLSKQQIIIDAKSGISGAGRNLNSEKLFSEGEDNFQAYEVQTHRHYPEILQIINNHNADLDVLFVPHLSSIIRGIFTTLYIRMDYDNINELITQYKSFYKDSPFVDVCDIDSFPKVSDVALTNNCKISLHKSVSDKGDINLVVFSIIDNLIKGASGQAVQNMNIMFGLDEKTALDF